MSSNHNFYKFTKEENLLELTNLPIVISVEEVFSEVVKKRIEEFTEKLAIPYFKSNGLEEIQEIEPIYNPVNLMRILTNGIYQSIESKNHKALKEALNKIRFSEYAPKCKLTSETELFRSRKGNHSDVKEFYHRKFDTEENEYTGHNNVSQQLGRFDTIGVTSWYLGRSSEVCEIETRRNDKSDKYSIINLHLKDEYQECPPLFLIDMTSEYIRFKDKEPTDYEIVLFPLYLACYCISENESNYNDIYRISQYLSQYIYSHRKEMDVVGIQYFTVRNEELNPCENTYKNICIFPEESNKSEDGYDMTLMNKFEFGKPQSYN